MNPSAHLLAIDDEPQLRNMVQRLFIGEGYRVATAETGASRSKYESIKKNDFHTDIRYILTERVLSVENEFNFRKDAILDAYYALKHLALNDREALGLDPNMTVVEQVPLVLEHPADVPLRRVGMGKPL